MLKIELKGEEYPARMVMGALLLFKRETGKDVSELEDGDLEDGLRLMWCCVKCASQADGKELPYDFETFCNLVTPQDVAEWNRSGDEDKKKVAL